ncbi:MAG TPA: inositol monophosphatase family protein [Candidatus Udaeobacter sp.]|nr:inositol monophosphatase family protein [Candidatus Udaeobacter sp.]
MDKSKFLEVAIEAAKNAEKIIMKHYSNDLTWQTKPDFSPVSIADTEAEKVIIKTIKEYFPDHSFLGEEYGSDNISSKYQWVIDPIDGTRNYVRKIPLFATQIALIENGEIILGVSNAPAMNEIIFAEKGKGAFLNGSKISVSEVKNLSESYVSFGGVKHFKNYGYLQCLLKLAESTGGQRGFGDAWSFHLLAQGKIDIIVEAKIKIWDIAALVIIIEEAGGKVTDINGNKITVSSTSIIATNNYLYNSVLEIFKK